MASREREKIYIYDEEERFRRKANLPARLLRFFRHASFRVKVGMQESSSSRCFGTNAATTPKRKEEKKHIFCKGNMFRVYIRNPKWCTRKEVGKHRKIRTQKTRCCVSRRRRRRRHGRRIRAAPPATNDDDDDKSSITIIIYSKKRRRRLQTTTAAVIARLLEEEEEEEEVFGGDEKRAAALDVRPPDYAS